MFCEYLLLAYLEAVVRRCSSKYVFLNISQISQAKTVLETLLNKVADPQTCKFTKKRLQYRCFPVKFAKFLRAAFFTEHLW